MSQTDLLMLLAVTLTSIVLAFPAGIALAGAALSADEGRGRAVLVLAGVAQLAMLTVGIMSFLVLPPDLISVVRWVGFLGYGAGLLLGLVLCIAALAGRAGGGRGLVVAVLAALLIAAGALLDILPSLFALIGPGDPTPGRAPLPGVIFVVAGIGAAMVVILVVAGLLVLIGRRWGPARPAVLLAAVLTSALIMLSMTLYALQEVVPAFPGPSSWSILLLSGLTVPVCLVLAGAGLLGRERTP